MKYNIGDKFWRVNKIFNRLTGRQNKLTMLDADGNEWYRYDKDTVEFDLRQVEIVGKYNAIVEGHNMWYEDDYCGRYCMKIGDLLDEVWEDELDGEHQGHYVAYFQTKDDAEEYIKEQSEYHNGL
jgi:hypothetical protein